jgi:flagellar hook-basal body complex protein FliE
MSIQTSFAAQLYESASRIAPPAIVPDEPGSAGRGSSFSEALAAAAGDMARTLRAGEAAAQSAMTGLALQAAVAVRDRVVEAYQEVLRMPV